MTCHYPGCLHVALKRRTVPRKAENRVCTEQRVFSKGVLPTAASTPPLPPPPATVTLVLGLVCDLKPTKPTKPTFFVSSRNGRNRPKGRLEHRRSGGLDAGVPPGGAVGAVEHREELDLFALLPHVGALGLRGRQRLGE